MKNRIKSRGTNLLHELKQAHKEIKRLREVIENLQKEKMSVSIPFDDMVYLIPIEYNINVDDLYKYFEQWDVFDSNERIDSRYIESGYFIIKEYSRNSACGVISCASILVTEKGQKWILNKLNEEKGE